MGLKGSDVVKWGPKGFNVVQNGSLLLVQYNWAAAASVAEGRLRMGWKHSPGMSLVHFGWVAVLVNWALSGLPWYTCLITLLCWSLFLSAGWIEQRSKGWVQWRKSGVIMLLMGSPYALLLCPSLSQIAVSSATTITPCMDSHIHSCMLFLIVFLLLSKCLIRVQPRVSSAAALAPPPMQTDSLATCGNMDAATLCIDMAHL